MPRDLIALFFFFRYVPRQLPSCLLRKSEKNAENAKKKKVKNNSDRGNRTPGCRVRDGDVNHYTISELPGELRL